MPEFKLADALAMVPQGAESVFSKPEYARRLSALRKRMASANIDLLLLSGPENVFYLSGQQTPGYYTFQCLCIPQSGEPFHVLRGLEAMNARLNTFIADIEGYDDDIHPAAAVASSLKARGWQGKRVALDRNSWFVPVSLYERLVAEFGQIADGSGLVEPLRRVKSELELQQIEKAAAANDAGMRAGLEATRAGVSENDIAAAIMGAAIKAGSEYLGMDPFVTSGARSGVPHTTWRRRQIEQGDLVALESCACYNRYHAALFRTVAIGKIPDLAKAMYQTCLEGLEVAIGKLRPGNTCADAHNAVQAVIDRNNFTNGYRKRTGYSIGISFAPDWGEGNILSLYRNVDVPLEPGMVFHVPIALREYGKFTVAVSETVAVTQAAARPLSRISREMREREVQLPEPDFALAERLFEILDRSTRDVAGFTRASYGEGEQFAHQLIERTAREVELAISKDPAGNLYATLPGRDPAQPTFLIGSHVDTVPQGGNFDGAAGVLAGLAVLSSWRKSKLIPIGDVAVMVIRAEESTWFPYSYIGSKAALGLLPASALDIARVDTGRTLAQHMTELGFDPEAVRRGVAYQSPQQLRGYVELHIEQGPVLDSKEIPVAIVTGIRGSFRYRDARVLGEYGHSGAVPRSYRHDAVLAAAEFVLALDGEWQRLEREGHDLTITFGKLFTDPAQHAFSKIAGEAGLCLDVRSHSKPTLGLVQAAVERHTKEIGEKYGVRFDLGPLTGSEPAAMDGDLIDRFTRAADELGIAHIKMASGAGHDAATFASAGVPAAMIFVRNQNGSHNPDEAMRMEDFQQAVRVLARGVADLVLHP